MEQETEVTLGEHQNRLKLLSNKLHELKQQKDEVKKQASLLEEEIVKVSSDLLSLMREQDLQNFKTPRGTFYVHNQTWCRILDTDKAFPYLREVGLGSLIKETVNTQSLSSDVRKLCEEGTIFLTDLENKGINVSVETSVRIRGAKNE